MAEDNFISLLPKPAIEGKFYIGFSAVGGVHQTGRIVEQITEGVFLAEVESIHGNSEHFYRVVHFQEMLSWRLYVDRETRDIAVIDITAAYDARVAEMQSKQAAEDAAKLTVQD